MKISSVHFFVIVIVIVGYIALSEIHRSQLRDEVELIRGITSTSNELLEHKELEDFKYRVSLLSKLSTGDIDDAKKFFKAVEDFECLLPWNVEILSCD